jgi:hypothetical protein
MILGEFSRSYENSSGKKQYQNSRFPRLLRGLYILTRPDGRVWEYSSGKGRFEISTLSVEKKAALPSDLGAGGPPTSWPSAALPDEGSLVFLPVYGSESVDRPPRVQGVVIADMDMSLLYTTIVPFFMARDLGEYPYRILETGTGTVLAEGGAPSAGRIPEALMGLNDPSAEGSGPPKAPAADSPSFSVDPLLQPWLQRTRGEGEPAAVPTDRGPSASAKAMLQIYYP